MQSLTSVRNLFGCSGQKQKRGVVAVLLAVILVVLLGFLGLVIDTGFLLAAHRNVQNAADAAATAAAFDKLNLRSDAQALATANEFVQTYNGNSTAPDLVDGSTFNIPPGSGPYAGNSDYVEVYVTAPVNTIFMGILGINSNNVTARAVAGFESVRAGEGVIVLDPEATPGLELTGGGTLRVNGRVIVNSEGGGVDENYEPIEPSPGLSSGSIAASAGSQTNQATGIYAQTVDVVGGVDEPAMFHAYAPPGEFPPVGAPSPLDAGALPVADPLIRMPTPVAAEGNTLNPVGPIAGGVYFTGNSSLRGRVKVTVDELIGIQVGYQAGTNSQLTAADVAAGNLPGPFLDVIGQDIFSDVVFQANDIILFPGIYSSIQLNGGRTFMIPGIYVISPTSNQPTVFQVAGSQDSGAVLVGRGVLIYNTGNSYSPSTGLPDINDGESVPPSNFNSFEDGTSFVGGASVSKSIELSPINTSVYDYASYFDGAPKVSSRFDGLLYFQRRRSRRKFHITGNAAEGLLTGTIYAKWALVELSGQGTYDSQFVIGSLAIVGQGEFTIGFVGSKQAKAPQVYLVE